ncbi:MAG: hypothetical protein AAFW46_14615 [Pseudomonadota bacterium]
MTGAPDRPLVAGMSTENPGLGARFEAIIRADPIVWKALLAARAADVAIGLPGWRLVSGAFHTAP